MDASNGRMIGLLERIANGVEGLKSEVTELKSEVTELKSEVTELKLDVAVLKTTVLRIDGRLDNMVGFTGAHHADHERRIAALEDHVFKKSG